MKMGLRSSHGDGPTLSGVLLVVFLLHILFIANVDAATIEGSNGLQMNLIPKFSKDSPLIMAHNLTIEQRYAQALQLSNKRFSRLSSVSVDTLNNKTSIDGIHPNYASAWVSLTYDSMYLVQVYIGMPPENQRLFLELDTGSHLTWVQCSGCVECFDAVTTPFEYFKSKTYELVSCDHPQCIPQRCVDDRKCEYFVEYVDETYSRGILSKDNFMMWSGAGYDIVSGVYFGCGFHNQIHWGKNDEHGNPFQGIFGMGRGAHSFLSQLGEQGQGRFSYCLTNWIHNRAAAGLTKLRFGDETYFPPGSVNIQSTPLIQGPYIEFYYVNLLDISVEGVSLLLPPDTFQIRADRTGGIYLDTGEGPSRIFRAAYDRMETRLRQIFSRFQLESYDPSDDELDWTEVGFCYLRPPGYDYFPSITFHFPDADFTPEPGATFVVLDKFFCLQIFPTDGPRSTIGSFTMTNYYFLYDIPARKVLFSRQECSLIL